MEWQPIETAPRDETEVLGWNMAEIRVIWWHQDYYGNAGFVCGFDGNAPDWFSQPIGCHFQSHPNDHLMA